MNHQWLRYVAISIVLAFVTTAAIFADDVVSRRDAARLQAKIERISRGGDRHESLRTAVTEAELNSYLRYELGDKLPVGVKDPWVSILGNGRLAGRASVDLTEVGQSHKSGGLLDPAGLLMGSLPVTVNGVLHTKNGVGTFSLESASVSGVPVPTWLLQEIVSSYSRSANAPQGVAIEKPFALPAGIREIELARGQATVVQ